MLISEVMDDPTDARAAEEVSHQDASWPLWYWRRMQLQLSSSQEAAQ